LEYDACIFFAIDFGKMTCLFEKGTKITVRKQAVLKKKNGEEGKQKSEGVERKKKDTHLG